MLVSMSAYYRLLECHVVLDINAAPDAFATFLVFGTQRVSLKSWDRIEYL